MDDARVEYGQALEREHLLGKVSERGWVAREVRLAFRIFFHKLKVGWPLRRFL